ncbi:MAG: hypothetical protein ACK5MZ_06670 [Aestuariibaculum sp.]
MITSRYNKHLKILETQYKGIVGLEEVLNYAIDIEKNIDYPRKLKILINAVDVKMNLSVNDLEIVKEAKTKTIKQYNSIIVAMIVNNPENAAKSMIYQIMVANLYRYETFSTQEAAIHWLDSF